MAATVPTTFDNVRGSGADMRFLMLEESSVLFKSNCFLLFSMESSSVWFVYLHTQTHNDLFNIFFAVSLNVIVFSDDVKMVSRATVVGCSSDVASFLIVEFFIVKYCVLVVLCLVEEVCSCVVDSCSEVVCSFEVDCCSVVVASFAVDCCLVVVSFPDVDCCQVVVFSFNVDCRFVVVSSFNVDCCSVVVSSFNVDYRLLVVSSFDVDCCSLEATSFDVDCCSVIVYFSIETTLFKNPFLNDTQ